MFTFGSGVLLGLHHGRDALSKIAPISHPWFESWWRKLREKPQSLDHRNSPTVGFLLLDLGRVDGIVVTAKIKSVKEWEINLPWTL
jgi:hypothetical protein